MEWPGQGLDAICRRATYPCMAFLIIEMFAQQSVLRMLCIEWEHGSTRTSGQNGFHMIDSRRCCDGVSCAECGRGACPPSDRRQANNSSFHFWVYDLKKSPRTE
jgi:hypothetical protein